MTDLDKSPKNFKTETLEHLLYEFTFNASHVYQMISSSRNRLVLWIEYSVVYGFHHNAKFTNSPHCYKIYEHNVSSDAIIFSPS